MLKMCFNLHAAPHLSVPLRPKVIKTPGGQRLLNPLQLNNLAQILPGTPNLYRALQVR